MRTTRWVWPPGSARMPLTVAGYGQIRHASLPANPRLVALADGDPPEQWGVL
jgi:hypothetical protein